MVLERTDTLTVTAGEIMRTYGRADILVNSAGITRNIPHGDLNALDDATIDAIFVANVRGPFAAIRTFAPLLRASGQGVIVNISSIAALRGTGSNIAYAGSKAALNTMSKALARVLGPEIRVLVISPGAVDTAFVPGRDKAAIERIANATPLKTVIQASDVAQAVMCGILHLNYTTGATVIVDGGQHL
jgi:3-oxoacyl-[acyl-carrier protein] reductase